MAEEMRYACHILFEEIRKGILVISRDAVSTSPPACRSTLSGTRIQYYAWHLEGRCVHQSACLQIHNQRDPDPDPILRLAEISISIRALS